mmetsp:Transcript_13960/g.35155  ORF Transcript_13960/g.35155 Transcript_13960/m.35155 type:complete len:212 (-) Transcript_13960:468-1103(-)
MNESASEAHSLLLLRRCSEGRGRHRRGRLGLGHQRGVLAAEGHHLHIRLFQSLGLQVVRQDLVLLVVALSQLPHSAVPPHVNVPLARHGPGDGHSRAHALHSAGDAVHEVRLGDEGVLGRLHVGPAEAPVGRPAKGQELPLLRQREGVVLPSGDALHVVLGQALEVARLVEGALLGKAELPVVVQAPAPGLAVSGNRKGAEETAGHVGDRV